MNKIQKVRKGAPTKGGLDLEETYASLSSV